MIPAINPEFVQTAARWLEQNGYKVQVRTTLTAQGSQCDHVWLLLVKPVNSIVIDNFTGSYNRGLVALSRARVSMHIIYTDALVTNAVSDDPKKSPLILRALKTAICVYESGRI